MKEQDEGFGLTEIMVSMLILAIIMMAILSLLIVSLTTVAKNGTRTVAAEKITERLEEARSQASTGECFNVEEAITRVDNFEDARGIPMTMSGTITCEQDDPPRSNPTIANLVVTVTTTDSNYTNPVSRTETDMFVKFDDPA